MAEIRDATREDTPALVAMARRFHAMAPHAALGEFDERTVTGFLRFLIDAPSAIVLTNGCGAIGGMMLPLFFNGAARVMEEGFCWAEGGGLELLDAFTAEAKRRDAQAVFLSTLENDKARAIARVLKRRGFEPLEHRYVLTL